ncbi:MAG TPA: TylF/MycF/NovP-related O-methyltransferase [Gemmatimonadales bacterium]|jgi:asparagine synthase (glutamine-hydrolysing)|nr:TylF/MycF/NovP-related O-methyltransferase [Gemmatimonadales bacterium]
MRRTLEKLREPWHALRASPLVRQVRKRHLTYLGYDALSDLERTVRRLDAEGVGGIILEAGCALGGSSVVLGLTKHPDRPLRVYDVFGMIPPPSEADGADIHARYETILRGDSGGIGGDKYYGYAENLREQVVNTLRSFGLDLEARRIELVQGLFQDTLDVDGPVALAHIDADWYESVRICLERIEPQLSPGGVLVIDDYEHWSGCRKAVDEYFADKRDRYRFIRRSRLHIVRGGQEPLV